MSSWLTLGIVGVTYLGIAIGSWPKLKTNRTTIALMGVGLLLAARQIPFNGISRFIDMDTIVLLFSMMVINANLRIAGFFQVAGNRLLRVARGPRGFLLLEICLAGVLSAFFLNDTIVLMLTPLVLDITLTLERNPLPYLIALATAANIGSVATLTGNPQNMIVGVASHISYTDFALALTPVALLALGIIWVAIVLLYPTEFDHNHFQFKLPAEIDFDRGLLVKSCIVTLGLVAAFLVGIPIAEAAFLAACVLLFTRTLHPEKVFAEFDWGLLVFFVALFIVTGSLESSGISAEMLRMVKPYLEGNVFSLSAVTVVLSNLVSNVPAVLLLKPIIQSLSQAQAGWLTLAAASTLAGNLTLLGSVANLIVAEIAARRQVRLGFWEYTRAGVIITLLSLVVGIAWLRFFVWA